MENLHVYKLLSPDSAGKNKDLLSKKSPEDGLRRVQALLAEWLRMENVVVLTAAGCSVEAGGRLMAASEENSLENLVLNTVEHCDISDNAKAIINWRKKNKHRKGSFEEWLSFLFSANRLVRGEQTPIHSVAWKSVCEGENSHFLLSLEDEETLKKYIEKAIYSECALELNCNELTSKVSKTSGHIPFLAKLMARDTNLGRTHLFTLNYDTLFEQALEELGIQYFDGFSGKANARFDPAVYGLDIYYPGDVSEGRIRRFDKFLQFYKLHGSLHWFVEDDGTCRAQHRNLSFAEKYQKSDVVDKAKKLKAIEYEGIGSLGILPISQKFAQTLDMPYAHLFRLFHARLNQPQTFLLVLGYGFGDNHVTRIIETALMNPSLVMLVVEPNPDSEIVERIARYQSLGQRAFVLTRGQIDQENCSHGVATFSDFARNIMPDVKWLEDFKRLKKFENEIRESKDEEESGKHKGGT